MVDIGAIIGIVIVVLFVLLVIFGFRSKLKKGGVIRTNPTGPLSGVTIIDLSNVIAGPWGTSICAELGAQVIKIETFKVFDSARALGAGAAQGMGGIFAHTGRAKFSMILDLKDQKGKDVFFKMVARADAVVQNFRAGVVDKMGIGYEDCKKVNPNIIYLSTTGFGKTGPLAMNKVYDPIIQAMVGVPFLQLDQEANEPKLMGQCVVDKMTAMTAAQALTAALFAREQGKGGQLIDLSMLGTMFQWTWPDGFQEHTFEEKSNQEEEEEEEDKPKEQKEQKNNGEDWKNLYPTKPEKAQYIDLDGAIESAAFQESSYLVQHLLMGKHRAVEFPADFGKTKLSHRECAPVLAEHTQKILHELGYTNGEIEQLLKSGAATSTRSMLESKGDGKSKIFKFIENRRGGTIFLNPPVSSSGRRGERASKTAPEPNKEEKSLKVVADEKEEKEGDAVPFGLGPLNGVKVLEISHLFAGPMAAQIFGDQSATVVKLEVEDDLDPTRTFGLNGDLKYGGVFATINTNKYSITLGGLDDDELVDKLLKWADVVLIDDDQASQLKITYDRAKKLNPSVIYVFNVQEHGELELQCMTGQTYLQMARVKDEASRMGPPASFCTDKRQGPTFVNTPMNAKATAAYIAISVSAALYARKKNGTGEGQLITVSAVRSAFHFSMPDVFWNRTWLKPKFMANFPEVTPVYDMIMTLTDGTPVFTLAISDKEFADMMDVFEPHLKGTHWEAKVEAWKGDLFGRIAQLDEVVNLFKENIVKFDYPTLAKAAKEKGLICTVVNTKAQAIKDPQVIATSLLQSITHKQSGVKYTVARPAAQFTKTKVPAKRRPASLPNEDAEKVRKFIDGSANAGGGADGEADNLTDIIVV